MQFRAFKYLHTFTFPVFLYVSFTHTGWITFLPVLVSFLLVPIIELLMKPDANNLSEAEAQIVAEDQIYDIFIYLIIPIQFWLVIFFLHSISEPGIEAITVVGRITAMGLMCGIYGINVAHELGHRSKWYEQLMAKTLLLTSLYMHFFIEHNRGHHKHVATPADAATALKGESIYRFWARSIVGSYLDAWKLEQQKLQKSSDRFYSIKNEMLVYHFIQLVFLSIIYISFGLHTLLFFMVAALMGILLLETVNYIEHYGLQRTVNESGNYERVMHQHSWNANHPLGRMMLFELTRHSDHHYKASRKYQLLKHHEESPQMPTGYPGMMLLTLLPALWFKVMDKKVDAVMKSTLVPAPVPV